MGQKSVTYRVRPVTRYIVACYTSETEADGRTSAECVDMGEFDSEAKASNAVLAFGDSETVKAQPPKFIFTHRPNTPPGYEQARMWESGVGWGDDPNTDAAPE